MIPIARLFILFSLLGLIPLHAYAEQPSASPSPKPKQVIRFLTPFASIPAAAQLELSSAVDHYNRLHPDSSIQLIRRGDQYSSLRELIAMFLAGDTPEIAVIEASEGPAIAHLEIAKPLGVPLAIRSELLHPGSKLPTIPFQRTIPVLIANTEILGSLPPIKRIGTPALGIAADKDLPAPNWPRNWSELEALLIAFKASRKAGSPLALPLHGSHGLWIFEAMAQPPLWQREQGGLRSERRLIPEIQSLRRLLDDGIASPGETRESAIQSFVDRQSLFLITSLDTLPEITRKASFPVSVGAAFSMSDRPALLNGGSDIIVTRDSPHAWGFLKYLFSDEVGPKWSAAGGWIPVVKTWKTANSLTQGAKLTANSKPAAFRGTDFEVVRARSAWVQALPGLFGKKDKRSPPEDVLLELDRHLSLR